MDLQPNKTDATIKPITNTRISASEWNQLVGSCMAFITAAGFTPDAEDNEQFLNAFKAIAANLELVGANTNLSNLTPTGEAHFAKPDLSNVTSAAGANLNAAGVVTVVSTWHSGTEWYRIWSDGWCEQGGKVQSATSVTLLKPYLNTDYSLVATADGGTGSSSASLLSVYNKTATGFYITTSENRYTACWEAKGYI